MTETNGNHDRRMDRIEKALELLIFDHEQFRHDHKQLLIAQVVQSEQIAELVKVSATHTEQIGTMGKRVDDLVSAIGQLIARIPPSVLTPIQ